MTPGPYMPPNRPVETVSPEEAEVMLADPVIGWRMQQLVLAGYKFDEAEAIAARRDIDLHKATDLLELGCSHETAAAILL